MKEWAKDYVVRGAGDDEIKSMTLTMCWVVDMLYK